VLDASKCISYLTIEHRGDLPPELEDKLSGWIYGCDICQEVCPWNITFSQISKEKSFNPREDLESRNINNWSKLTEEDFRILFKKSAVKRTKFVGLKRNINSAQNQTN
jgi:epoxyqueuosine reductase